MVDKNSKLERILKKNENIINVYVEERGVMSVNKLILIVFQ